MPHNQTRIAFSQPHFSAVQICGIPPNIPPKWESQHRQDTGEHSTKGGFMSHTVHRGTSHLVRAQGEVGLQQSPLQHSHEDLGDAVPPAPMPWFKPCILLQLKCLGHGLERAAALLWASKPWRAGYPCGAGASVWSSTGVSLTRIAGQATITKE